MGIREIINEKSSIAVPVGCAILVIAMIVNIIVFKRVFKQKESVLPPVPEKFYYSDDDGESWFMDDAKNVPPYDHNGKPAVQAALVRCKNGKVMVNFLKQYTPAGVDYINDQISHGADPVVSQYQADFTYAEYKKPGDKEWVLPNLLPGTEKNPGPITPNGENPAMVRIRTPKCSDGSTTATPVEINENAMP